MSQSRKHRGYKSQTIVAEYLQKHGWPYAQSAGAGRTGSDITGVPFDVEVKARRGLNISAVMKQLKERKTKFGFGVLRLDGQGEKNIDEWVAVLRLEDLITLLKRDVNE